MMSLRFSSTALRLSFLILALFASRCAPTMQQPVTPPPVVLQDPLRDIATTPDEAFTRGYEDYKQGRMARAREQFEKVIARDPEYFPAQLALGYTYYAEDAYDQAELYFRRAIELNPDYAQARHALSLIHENRQEYDAALAELNEVARINPEFPGLQENRNVVKLKATEFHLSEARRLAETNPDEAIAHLKSAQQLAPEIPQIPLNMADIRIKQGNCEEAIPHLEDAAGKDDSVEIKQKLAYCYAERGRAQEALLIYEEMARLQPNDSDVQARIADLKRELYLQSLPADFQTIPSAPQVTRAQFAALMMVNLEFLRNYSTGESLIITDTIHHWAKPFIQQVVNLGIIDLFPNRTFQPNRAVTKLELAKAASRIVELLELRQNKSLSTQEPVSIPDISTANVYYPMIAKALSARVISLDGDGKFHPGRPVPGSEAISMVNRIRELTEST